MINTGLVSVTFRQLTPQAIVDLVRKAELEAIEWGGDVHVPHGEELSAHTVRQMTLDAGLRIPSYGSYYRVGHDEPVPFTAVIETALTLGVSVVRVWAGKQGSAEADADYRHRVVQESVRIAGEAEQAGLTLAYEFHANTLTDTYASAIELLERVDHQAMRTYWQPPQGCSVEENVEGLMALLPWLTNVHVFSWRSVPDAGATGGSRIERAPLHALGEAWHRYFEVIGRSPNNHYALLEFVRDDTPEQFLEDAATLKAWVEPYRSGDFRMP